jgi:hypothetical protein
MIDTRELDEFCETIRKIKESPEYKRFMETYERILEAMRQYQDYLSTIRKRKSYELKLVEQTFPL